MNSHPLLNPIALALSQSQALLSLAQASDWDSFETLVQQRQQGLLSLADADYLQSLTDAGLAAKAAVIINEIQAINEQLSQLALKDREQIATDLRHSAQAAKAIDAYSR